MKTYAIHRAASLFPQMGRADFEELIADIREQGQRDPIIVHEGQIIDGRHRYWACQQLGIAPCVRGWDGQGSLVTFILSRNLHRRHLTPGQRAIIAKDMLPLLEEEARKRQVTSGPGIYGGKPLPIILSEGPQGDARDQAAAMVGASPGYVSAAKRLTETAPDALEAVRAGTITIPEAKLLEAEPAEVRAAALSLVQSGEAPKVRAALETVRAGRPDSDAQKERDLAERWKKDDDVHRALGHMSRITALDPHEAAHLLGGIAALRTFAANDKAIADRAIDWLREYSHALGESLGITPDTLRSVQ